jgi:hypothetical protein
MLKEDAKLLMVKILILLHFDSVSKHQNIEEIPTAPKFCEKLEHLFFFVYLHIFVFF